MSKAPRGVIWPANKHTIAKVAIVRMYAYIWVSILGRTCTGKRMLYIDGFSGPGEYAGGEKGSPVAFIESAQEALSAIGPSFVADRIECIFVEQRRARCKHLAGVLEAMPQSVRIKHRIVHGRFEDLCPQIEQVFLDNFSTSAPLLAFLDPFGVRGVSFELMSRILAAQCSEVFLLFDGDGIARIAASDNSNAEQIITDAYGDPEVLALLSAEKDFVHRTELALALYRKRLADAGVDLTFPFAVSKGGSVPDYYLLFATRSEKALKKMKEVMRRMSNDGSHRFSANPAPQMSLPFDDFNLIEHLKTVFQGRTVAKRDIERCVLINTPETAFLQAIKNAARDDLVRINDRTPGVRSLEKDQSWSVEF